ncbi:MAG: ThuA domain-containing protein [Planctomycetia bacterium]|nr:ThuA domain-containing protein [Planctomycetia bacterium]
MFRICFSRNQKAFLFAVVFGLFLTGMNLFAAEGKIRVLFVSGGHSFDAPAFDQFLASFPQLEITRAVLPKDRNKIAPGLENDFDVLFLYDQDNTPLSDQQKKNFTDLLRQGIGVFALHHHLSAHQDWDEHYDIIGGRDFFMKKINLFRGKEYPRSTFIDDVDIDIKIADPNHPITKGIKPFIIKDEAYGLCPVRPDVHVLLTSDHPKATRQVAWTWRYGNSPIFVNMLGHGPSAWKQPEFARIFIQAMNWLSEENKAIKKQ